MKPRIWWSKNAKEWYCILPSQYPAWRIGFGTTPQEAYADWKRKTDSLNRIDADQTQA